MIFVAMSLYIHTWPWLGDSVWRMSNTRMQLLWLLCKVMFSQIIWPSLIPDLASLDTLNPTWWETWHWCPRKNHWPCPNFLNPTSASYKMHILELRASKIWNGLWWKTIPPHSLPHTLLKTAEQWKIFVGICHWALLHAKFLKFFTSCWST